MIKYFWIPSICLHFWSDMLLPEISQLLRFTDVTNKQTNLFCKEFIAYHPPLFLFALHVSYVSVVKVNS